MPATIPGADAHRTRTVSPLPIVFTLLVCLAGGQADAQGTGSGGLVTFDGLLRPGDIPRNVTIDARAFADEARAEPECTPTDHATGLCSTQLQSSSSPVPLSPDEALVGSDRRTAFRHANGELVLTFNDFLPMNGAGPDLAVFQGFTQAGFAIKVRSREGTEYGFVDVDGAPFIQGQGVDGVGPCPPVKPLDTCGPFPNLRSQILLLFEVDLDDLGVPAGTAVEEVRIKRKQSPDTFGTVPFLVMVGATNTFEVAPTLSEHIKNGRFADGLAHWTVVGNGSVQVNINNTATMTAPDVPVALTQTIDTPNESFQIVFDRLFTTDVGTLLVSLDGLVIHKAAGFKDTWKRETIYVNDPALMDLKDVELRLELLPGSNAEMVLTNIGIPQVELDPGVTFELQTELEENLIPQFSRHVENLIVLPGNQLEIMVENFLPAPERSWATARAELLLTGAVRFGFDAHAYNIDDPSCPSLCGEVGLNVSKTNVKIRYAHRVELDGTSPPPASGRVDVGWDLTIGGALERSIPLRCYALVFGGVTLTTPHAESEELWDGFARLFDDDPVEIPDHLNERGWTDDDWFLFSSQYGNGTSYRTQDAIGLRHAAQLKPGDTVELEFQLGAEVSAPEGCYGAADFIHTFEAVPVSDTPGVRFVLTDTDDGNRAPVANAGADRFVEATSPAGATVTLDGSGSTDPDGDALTYEWTGPFGTASGVAPTVVIPLGSHTVTLNLSDLGGLSHVDTVDITVQDTTPPVITPPANLTVFATGATTPVVIGTATAVDAVGVVSGPHASTPGPFAPGETTVTWTAVDAAGNVGSAVQLVTVNLDFAGFSPPVDPAPVVNTARAGRGVPVKWQVRSGAGGYIGDPGIVEWVQYVPIACPSGGAVDDTVIADTTGNSGLHYDPVAEQFVYVWQTPDSLAGSCAQLHLALTDGSHHTANFLFK